MLDENGILLAGGGIYAAYQVGVLQSIKNQNANINIFAGVSTGAITAALTVGGAFECLEEFWTRVSYVPLAQLNMSYEFDMGSFNGGFLKLINALIEKASIDLSEFKQMLLLYLDEKAVRNSNKKLLLFGLDDSLETDLLKLEDIKVGELVDTVLASMVFPAFTKCIVNGKVLVPDGIPGNLLINKLASVGVGRLLCVCNSGDGVDICETGCDMNIVQIWPSGNMGSMMSTREDIVRRMIEMGREETYHMMALQCGKFYNIKGAFGSKEHDQGNSGKLAELIDKKERLFIMQGCELYVHNKRAQTAHILAVDALLRSMLCNYESVEELHIACLKMAAHIWGINCIKSYTVAALTNEIMEKQCTLSITTGIQPAEEYFMHMEDIFHEWTGGKVVQFSLAAKAYDANMHVEMWKEAAGRWNVEPAIRAFDPGEIMLANSFLFTIIKRMEDFNMYYCGDG